MTIKKDLNLKTVEATEGVEKFEVTGFESVVPQIRKIDSEIEELLKRRQGMKDLILSRVKELKKSQEQEGCLYKSFVIVSDVDPQPVVLFKNQFKKLDLDNEEVMRKILNGKFDELFEKSEDVKLKKKIDFDVLRKVLGDKFGTYFTDTEFIAFKDDFMELRAALRKKMGKKQNAVVDKWTADNQASPDLRMKG